MLIALVSAYAFCAAVPCSSLSYPRYHTTFTKRIFLSNRSRGVVSLEAESSARQAGNTDVFPHASNEKSNIFDGENVSHQSISEHLKELEGTQKITRPEETAKAVVVSSTSNETPPFPIVLWRFTRPHTLIGSALAIPSLHLLAAPTYKSFFTTQNFIALAYAMFPSLLMNLYITGLNQITDVEIDKVNKPGLPIANGDLKKKTAIKVVLLSLLISLLMSIGHPIYGTQGLQIALWGSFLLGTMYSLPPIRLKRHPFLAAFCIVAVRGTIINAGFYSHALSSAYGLGNGATVGVLHCLMNDWKCALSSLFFGVFGIVIALMKDVPDAKGDRIFNIRSFTVRVGQERIFNSMKALLTALFGVVGGAFFQWATMAPNFNMASRRILVGLGCLLAGLSTNWEARKVDPEDSDDVYSYYMHLWKIFYSSYLVLPLVK